MNNFKRLKKLVLANKETRRLYRMMQFLAIFMVISCTIIVVVAKWIEQDQNQKREELFGSWDEVFLDVPAEDLNYFKQNAFLEQISIQSIQEKVFLEGDKRVVIGSCDDNFLEMGNIELLEGRMPEKENEVAVEEEYLGILGVTNKGDTVPLDSKVKSLRGYTVTGIVENYSNKWKIINNTIRYLNCFIFNYQNEKVMVYVKYNNWSIKDQEINLINYHNNFSKIEISYKIILLRIIVIGIMFNIVFFLKLFKKRSQLKLDLKKEPMKSRKINPSFLEIITIILLIFTIFNIASNIYSNNSLPETESYNIEIKENDMVQDISYYWIDDSKSINQLKILDYNFDTNVIILFLVEILQALLFIMIVIDISVSKCISLINNKESFYFNNKYLYGVDAIDSKEINDVFKRQNYIYILSFFSFSIYVFLLYKNHLSMVVVINVLSGIFSVFVRTVTQTITKFIVAKNTRI